MAYFLNLARRYVNCRLERTSKFSVGKDTTYPLKANIIGPACDG